MFCENISGVAAAALGKAWRESNNGAKQLINNQQRIKAA